VFAGVLRHAQAEGDPAEDDDEDDRADDDSAISWRLRVFAHDGSELFRGDATFCVRPGALAGSVVLESSNHPGWFLRRRGNEPWVDHDDGTATFDADSSFAIRHR
jgi:hypothetical protein